MSGWIRFRVLGPEDIELGLGFCMLCKKSQSNAVGEFPDYAGFYSRQILGNTSRESHHLLEFPCGTP